MIAYKEINDINDSWVKFIEGVSKGKSVYIVCFEKRKRDCGFSEGG